MLEIMKASAGSGKTYNLAKQYISLLLENPDRYAYRHILAVTFTNKATDEMKSRILKELHVLATDPASSDYHDSFVPSVFPSDQKLQEKSEAVLHDILHDYSAFAVSTIDKFFQQTLKAFSREIGQFASYQVELDKDSLVAESVDRVLDSLTEEAGSLLSWLTANVLERIEQGERYSMDANLLEMACRLKSVQRQEVLETEKIDEDLMCSKEHLMEVRERCRELISSFQERVVAVSRQALDILEQAGVNPSESNRGFLSALYNYAEPEIGATVKAPTEAFVKKALDSSQWFSKAKAKTYLPLVSPFLEAPLEDFCALFGKEYAVYNTALIIDNQLYGLGVAGELNKAFKELMKEKNVLCIDDSNTILRDIIDGSDAPFVYEKLGVRFEHFLLDEFQDTAHVQWQNFKPLLQNSDSQDGKNLIVGDVKQSIYRWRGSDWKLLNDEIPSEFPQHKERILKVNYRSLPNIVNFNNDFFCNAAKVLDKMDGIEEDGPVSRIYADVVQEVAKTRAPGSVSVSFCPKDMQLQAVLDSISEVRSAGANLSEVAVLVRSNAIGEEIAHYLIDNGINVITDDSLKVKGAVTVRRLMSLMSFVDNPEDTVNGYLARSMDVSVPEGCLSLIDMAESLLRSVKKCDNEGLWKGEVLHVQSFMDYLQDYVSSNGNNLRGFLKWWEEENPSISSPASGESVRVMTIHKSKGLDFPYVIIPYAENITLYKAGQNWCAPDLDGTSLEGVAEGVYDVTLSSSSASTLFSEDYKKENFLQHIDNINTLYVAMTRPALGMHIIAKTPPAKCVNAVADGDVLSFTDFSQMLYWYLSQVCTMDGFRRRSEEDLLRYDIGELVDFNVFRKVGKGVEIFDVSGADSYPSIPLNPEVESTEDGEPVDVRERGRLKYSADSVDFFNEDGDAGISASKRIKGVVLHDILSRISVPSDLDDSILTARISGDINAEEAEQVRSLLVGRLEEVENLGWFAQNADHVYNEATLIDTDGKLYRPDRVVINGRSVLIVDYKFGEHHSRYSKQLATYADLWKRMGYDDVSASLWYVQTGEIVKVV